MVKFKEFTKVGIVMDFLTIRRPKIRCGGGSRVRKEKLAYWHIISIIGNEQKRIAIM